VISDSALAVALAACFTVIVFVATGGTDLGPNTWIEIALLAIGAASAVALVLVATDRRAARGSHTWAIATVALFAALAALTYLSIAWSVQPANSWVEANRTLAYLAAFGAAVALARMAPGRWPAVLGAVAIATVAVCGYALLAKVFPASLNAGDHSGRLRVPFGYWNATGLMAALGVPVCLWAGTRPSTSRVLRALSVPALVVLITTLMLSYSRGSLLAVVLGVGCWFVLVPLRLRATLVLALGAVGGALTTGWALANHAITHDTTSLTARTAAGHHFGLVLLAVLALSTLAGLAAARAMDRVVLPAPVRRRIGIALLILVAMVPVVALAGAAASSRGLTGEISHAWSTLTSSNSGVGNNASRLAALGNSRGLYWREGLRVGEHAPLAGVGAGGFDTARTRYSTSTLAVAHAHSYLIETFADFGLIGIALTLALLTAWALAVRRTLTGSGSDENLAAERAGMVTLLAVVVTFGVSSLIDWTWFIPGVAVPALACAGWLAGRDPLAAPAPAPDQQTPAKPARRPAITPATAAAGLGIFAAALIAGWFVWQPLHSSNSMSAAIDAMGRGDAHGALADAQSAASSDPVSVDPLWALSAIYASIGDPAASRRELVAATRTQPSNPQTWQQLGSFDLQAHRAQLALSELDQAGRLDRTSGRTVLRQLINQAQSELLTAQHGRTGSA
jgi:O-antigen ligase